MSPKKIEPVLFFLFAVIAGLLLAVPIAVSLRYGQICSWEGFLRARGFLGVKGALCLAIVIVGFLALMAVQKKLTFQGAGKVKWGCLCVVAAIAVALFPRDVPLTARWFEKHALVAHAGGRSPNGKSYENSLESFEYNYQQGHRVFEGDLSLTADGVLVLEHDWQHWCKKTGAEYTGDTVTYEQFMASRFDGTDTPMDLAALIDLMLRHKDMYFMTDFKNCYDKEQVVSGFQQMVQAAKDAGHKEILKRVIVQNHHNEFKHWVDEVYPFENWLYTMYSIERPEEYDPWNLVAYCEEEGIGVITMRHTVVNAGWLELTRPLDIRIYTHTVDDPDRANELIAAGVAGIYTDDIMPDQVIPTTW